MATNYQQLETVLVQLTPDESRTVLRFAEFLLQQHQPPVEARAARRAVSAWLVSEVGNLLMGGEPVYVPGDRPVWRVPVLVSRGRQGCATHIHVDAYTGDLLITAETPEKVLRDVQTFIAGSASN